MPRQRHVSIKLPGAGRCTRPEAWRSEKGGECMGWLNAPETFLEVIVKCVLRMKSGNSQIAVMGNKEEGLWVGVATSDMMFPRLSKTRCLIWRDHIFRRLWMTRCGIWGNGLSLSLRISLHIYILYYIFCNYKKL
jgi:hypothetical protein